MGAFCYAMCKRVPPGPCPHCGGITCWHQEGPAGVYHSCCTCGYVDEPVKHDPVLRALLMAEATKRAGTYDYPSRLPPLGQEHQIRYMLAVERSLAELRSIP